MTSPREYRNLALIGFMGTGKSTVGHFVADHLRFGFIDTDHLIELWTGKSVSQFFAQEGEAAFREQERRVVAELAGRRRSVIATGGGIGANPEHLASLKTHALVVCLWASPEVIWERVRHQTHRPLLRGPNPLARIRELLAQRAAAYRQADVLLDTGFRQSEEVARQALHHFQLARRGRGGP